MFDEQNQNSSAPKNLPTEPVDMFAGVEKNIQPQRENQPAPPQSSPDALSVGLLKKKDEAPMRGVPQKDLGGASSGHDGITYLSEGKMSAPILGKILLFLGIVLLLGGLAYGGWWFFYGSKKKVVELPATPTNQIDQSQTSAPASTGDTSTNIPAQINNDQILFGQAVDSDNDGLDDVREKEIGTDPQKIDTDADGLSDGDEVIVYKTNPLLADTDSDGLSDGDETLIWHSDPLNPDTDSDSYQDGEEVRNGYSPIGPGKLFSAPSTTTTGATSTSGT